MIDGSEAGAVGGVISRFSVNSDGAESELESVSQGDTLNPSQQLKVQYAITKYELEIKLASAFIGVLRTVDSYAIDKIQ